LLLTSDIGTATAAAAPQLKASLPIASKPPRVLDTEARRAGSLPLRDPITNVPAMPEASKAIANAPAQLKFETTALTSPVLSSGKDSPGPQLAQSPDTTANPDHPAVNAKTPGPDNPDPAASPAISAANSPALPQQIGPQPDNLPAASPVAVIPTPAGQALGSQAPATNPADTAAQPSIPASTDATTGRAVLVPSTQVVQGVAQSEMHIGFRTPAFGSVEVHTAVRDTTLGLAVSSEKGDLRGFLTQEVPALQTVFHQQGLQFDQIRFMTPGSLTGTGFSGGSDSNSNSNSNSPGNERNPRSWFSQDGPEPEIATSEIQNSTTRLSVHA